MSFLLPNLHQAMLLLTWQIQTCMKSMEIWLFYVHQVINRLNVQMYIKPWKFFVKTSRFKIPWEPADPGGSVGCAVRLETRRSPVQPPSRSATFFRGDWSWNIFYGHSLPSADSRRAVVSFWRKNVHNTKPWEPWIVKCRSSNFTFV